MSLMSMAATTVSYTTDTALSIMASGSSASKKKISNPNATLFILGNKSSNDSVYSGTIAGIPYAGKTTGYGGNNGSSIVYIKGTSVYVLNPGDFYRVGPYGTEFNNNSSITRFDISSTPDILDAEHILDYGYGTYGYIAKGKIYNFGTITPNDTGIIDYKLFGSRAVVKKSSGIYMDGIKLGDAGDSFDFLKESAFVGSSFIFKKPSGGYKFLAWSYAASEYANLSSIDYAVSGDPTGAGAILGTSIDGNKVVVDLKGTVYSLPRSFAGDPNVKKILGVALITSLYSTSEISIAYIDTSGNLKVSKYTASPYAVMDADNQTFVGEDTISGFTWSDKATAVRGNGNFSTNTGGWIVNEGATTVRITAANHSTAWVKADLTTPSNFDGIALGSNPERYFSIAANGDVYSFASYSAYGPNPEGMIINGSLWNPVKTGIENGTSEYVGSVEVGSYVEKRSGGAPVNTNTLGLLGSRVLANSPNLDTPFLGSSAPVSPSVSYTVASAIKDSDPDAEISYLGYSSGFTILKSDGTLLFTGDVRKIYNWQVSSPIEVPFTSVVAPTGIKATKGASNNSVSISWDSQGVSGRYSVIRGSAGAQEVVVTNLATQPFVDVKTTGGSKPSDLMNYKVSSEFTHGVYLNNTGYLKTNGGAGGCDFFNTDYTKECAGWRASPPSSLTVNTVNVEANAATALVDGFTTVDPDVGYDAFTYSVDGAPAHGAAVKNPTDGKIYYTPFANYFGPDSFVVKVTDKAGNSINGTAGITVSCPAPKVNSITIPVNFPALSTQLATIAYTSNGCNGAVTATAKFFNVATTQEITSQAQTLTNQASGTLNLNIPISDLDPDKYRIEVKLVSENATLASTNIGTKNQEFTVNGYGTFNLNLAKTIYSEDELIKGIVAPDSGGCAITDINTARNESKCYIVWSANPIENPVSATPDSTQGYNGPGSNYVISADIFKFDSHLIAHKITSVSKTYSVLPGLPTMLKPVTFTKPLVRWMDRLNYAFQRQSGYDCKMKTNLTDALASVGGGFKTCLLEAVLPDGLSWAATTIDPTIVGRIDKWSSGTPNTNIHFKLSKYYGSAKPSEIMIESDISIPVVDFVLTPSLQKDKLQYAVKASKANVVAQYSAKLPADATACAFSPIETDAATAYRNSGSSACFVEWDLIPPGLVVDTLSATPKLTGIPTQLGMNPIGFSVYVVKPNGAGSVREIIAKYTDSLSVVDLLPIDFSVVNLPNGSITLSGENSPRPLVGNDGKIGDVKVVGGDFSTIRMTVLEAGSLPQIYTGLKNGDSKPVSLSVGAKGAWLSREATIKLEYEDSLTMTPIVKTFLGTQLPEQRVATTIAMPLITPNDTDPFTLTTTIGFPISGTQLQYNPVRDGQWEMSLQLMQGMNLVPASGGVNPDNLGVATFTDLSYTTYVGQQIYSVATMVPPNGSVLSGDVKKLQSATGIKLTFVSGGALHGDTVVSRVSGSAPLKETLDVKLSADAALALKNIVWFVSSDSMTTWAPLGALGRNVTYTFNKGGVYFIKGQMTNKFTGITSWSDPVSITVYEKVTPTIISDDVFLPGTTVPVSMEVKGSDGNPLSEYDSRWEVTSSNGDVNNYENVSSVEIQSAIAGTFDVSVMVKSKTTPAQDPNSWTTVTKKIVFSASTKPKILITGPRLLEVGKTGAFTVKVSPPWDSRLKSSVQLAGKWILPNGTESTEATLNFSPVASDGLVQKIKYQSWIVGHENDAVAIAETPVSITAYIFPNFVMKSKVDSLFAPAYVKIYATPETKFDYDQMRGKKLTYTWTLPANLKGTANGAGVNGIAETIGTYDYQLTISDDRGNSQSLDYSLTLDSSRPYDFTFVTQSIFKFNRNPMTYVLRPKLMGGHPRDRVATVEAFIDGVSVYKDKMFPRTIIVPTAGTHVIKLLVTSVMGNTVEASNEVTVLQNSVPQCDFVERWLAPSNAMHVTINCTDTDGRVIRVKWFKDDVDLKKYTSAIYLNLTTDAPSAVVRAIATDDAGAEAVFERTFTRPN